MARVLLVSTGLIICLGTLFYVFVEGLRRRGYDISIGQAALELGEIIGIVVVLLGGIALAIYGMEKR